MTIPSPILSVVIPIKDEALNVEPLATELTETLDRQPWSWECIWVDDGSTDDSLFFLERISQRDNRHMYVTFEKNSGQSAALYAGFCEAKGPILATLDGDGQNDPSDIPRLVEIIQSGNMDMVNGYRKNRKDTLFRKVAGRIANIVRNKITGNTVRDVGCSTRAFRRECIHGMPKYKGMHRFLPTLVAMNGFRIGEIPVNHRPRLHGKTNYGIHNRLWVGVVDTLGVLWLQKRSFRYKIKHRLN